MKKPLLSFHTKKNNTKLMQVISLFLLFYLFLISSLFYNLYPEFFMGFFIFLIISVIFLSVSSYLFFYPKVLFYEDGIVYRRIFSTKILFSEIKEHSLYKGEDGIVFYICSKDEKIKIYLPETLFNLGEVKGTLEKFLKKK